MHRRNQIPSRGDLEGRGRQRRSPRITVADFQQHPQPVLQRIAGAGDADAARAAKEPMGYWRTAMSARAKPATIAARLAQLPER